MKRAGHKLQQMGFRYTMRKNLLIVIMTKLSERFSWRFSIGSRCGLSKVTDDNLLLMSNSSYFTFPVLPLLFLLIPLILMSKSTNSSSAKNPEHGCHPLNSICIAQTAPSLALGVPKISFLTLKALHSIQQNRLRLFHLKCTWCNCLTPSSLNTSENSLLRTMSKCL